MKQIPSTITALYQCTILLQARVSLPHTSSFKLYFSFIAATHFSQFHAVERNTFSNETIVKIALKKKYKVTNR